MSLFLAIDAGGSKTECLLADERRVLARASTGTVKLMRVSSQVATARLERMLDEVAQAAKVKLRHVTRTCFGLAGLSSVEVPAWAMKTMAEAVGGTLLLCGDEEIALDGAFAGGPGIVVVAGTGSNAIGRVGAAGGATFRAGGWGPVLGDEGSGYWIGLEGIRAALRAQDRIGLGGVSTCLLREIEQEWGFESLGELVGFANQRAGEGRAAPDFAALAPVVACCAADGDALAAGILERAGEELADLAAIVFHKMTAAGDEAALDEMEIAVTGGVLAQVAPVRAAMAVRLATSLPGVRMRAAAVHPLDGALWRARRG